MAGVNFGPLNRNQDGDHKVSLTQNKVKNQKRWNRIFRDRNLGKKVLQFVGRRDLKLL